MRLATNIRDMDNQDKSKQGVESLLGRKMKADEKVIFDLMKDDDRYYFVKGKNGWLEAHIHKNNPSI